MNKQAHFRTLRAGKVPEESGYLVRDFLLGERWEMHIGPMNSFAEFRPGSDLAPLCLEADATPRMSQYQRKSLNLATGGKFDTEVW